MRVRDVMTSTVVSINADTPINEVLAVMQMNNVNVLSVTREHECAGVLSEEDIHTQMSRRGMDPTVTTAGSAGLFSRLTKVCRVVTMRLARTIGSLVVWG